MKKSLLALAALPVAFLTTGCVPGLPGPLPTGGTVTTTVTRVVDGDTVKLSNGETVRLIGIDTPEKGQCGFNEATNLMRSLVQGQTVAVTSRRPRRP